MARGGHKGGAKADMLNGMAAAIWEHVGGDRREVPDAAREAADELGFLYEDVNRRTLSEIVTIVTKISKGEDYNFESLGIEMGRQALEHNQRSWLRDFMNEPRFKVAIEGDELVWEGESDRRATVSADPLSIDERARARRNPVVMKYPCTDCGGQGPHEGPGHEYTTAPKPGALMEYPCTACGGRGEHKGGGHAYTTAEEPRGNPLPKPPTVDELARAFRYIEHEFRVDDGEVSGEQWAEGLAFYRQEYPTDEEDLRVAREVLPQLPEREWVHIAARAQYLRDEQGLPRRNPVGDRVDVTSGPGRGRSGVVKSETKHVARVRFDRGGEGHVERSALRTRRNPAETFVAKAVRHDGREMGTWESPSVAGAMRLADDHDKVHDITIRGENTSDGTHWGPGRGRVVAVREGKRWQRY